MVRNTPFLKSMIRLCEDGWRFGWHERNAGNLSYLLDDGEVGSCAQWLCEDDGGEWLPLHVRADRLAGRCIVVTGAGRYMRDARNEPERTFGIVRISDSGSEFRIVWGLEGGRPTSEFPTHVIAHEARLKATDGKSRVVYHAHCPNVIALSNILEADSKVWTRALWKTMTECVLFFPEGLGVVPWMVPGGSEIAVASGRLLESHAACVWTQHGLFATGQDCNATFGLAHMIEKTAGIYLQGRAACGGADTPFFVGDSQLRRICRESGVALDERFLASE